MKHTKRVIAGLLALGMTAGFAACAKEEGGNDNPANANDGTTANANTEAPEVTTTPQATVDINTYSFNDEEMAAINAMMEKLRDFDLENKEITFMSNWNMNPDGTGGAKKIELEMFEQKYGAKVIDRMVDYDSFWDTLGNAISAGDGPDFFDGPGRVDSFPNGVAKGAIMPVDDYIDINSAMWADYKAAMELYSLNGKHFGLVVNTSPFCYGMYNKDLIDEYGLDDPWELYQKGEWNWDALKKILTEFVDADPDEHYGLDDWFNAFEILGSCGNYPTKLEGGKCISNLDNPVLEKAMLFGEDLRKNNLIRKDGNRKIDDMAAGKEIFCFSGYWEIWMANGAEGNLWGNQMSSDNLGLVPVPGPAGEKGYQRVQTNGFMICQGAKNPQGAALFAECALVANNDDAAKEISKVGYIRDYGWTEDMWERKTEIENYARANPALDFTPGMGSEINLYFGDGGQAGDEWITPVSKAVFDSDKTWAEAKTERKDQLQTYLDEINKTLVDELAKLG